MIQPVNKPKLTVNIVIRSFNVNITMITIQHVNKLKSILLSATNNPDTHYLQGVWNLPYQFHLYLIIAIKYFKKCHLFSRNMVLHLGKPSWLNELSSFPNWSNLSLSLAHSGGRSKCCHSSSREFHLWSKLENFGNPLIRKLPLEFWKNATPLKAIWSLTRLKIFSLIW